MKLHSIKVTAFEANLISDPEFPNDFYTIQYKFDFPVDIDDLAKELLHFISDSITPELADTDYAKNPEVIIIVSGFTIAFSDDYAFINYGEFEAPFVKLSINQTGKLSYENLLEES